MFTYNTSYSSILVFFLVFWTIVYIPGMCEQYIKYNGCTNSWRNTEIQEGIQRTYHSNMRWNQASSRRDNRAVAVTNCNVPLTVDKPIMQGCVLQIYSANLPVYHKVSKSVRTALKNRSPQKTCGRGWICTSPLWENVNLGDFSDIQYVLRRFYLGVVTEPSRTALFSFLRQRHVHFCEPFANWASLIKYWAETGNASFWSKRPTNMVAILWIFPQQSKLNTDPKKYQMET